MEVKDTAINQNTDGGNADYKKLYLTAMNDLQEISNAAISAQRRLEEMFLIQTDQS